MKKERGVVFILVLLALTTVILLGGTFVQFGINQQKFSEFDNQGTQAFYLAESAIDQGLVWLRGQLVPPQGVVPVVLFGGWNNQQTGTGNGAFLARVIPDPGNPASPIKRYTIEGRGISGTVANPTAARQTSLVVQTESFATYAYFTNNERSYPQNNRVYFISGDRVEGPTHTNGQFSMYKRPVFDGLVTSVAEDIYYYRGERFTQPVFNGGLILGVPPKTYPTEFPDSVVSAAQSGGTVLEGDTDLVLLSNGTMQVTNEDAGWVEEVRPLPANGVLYVDDGEVTLRGTLQGQLTIGAEENVRITDDVTYSDNPRNNPDSTDVLGIISGENVIVDRDAPRNVDIEASIIALDRSFGVENWWVGPARGTLGVYGGIIQANRGIVGRFNSRTGQPISGYKKSYHYDERLRTIAPPFFPTTGEYDPLLWQEQ